MIKQGLPMLKSRKLISIAVSYDLLETSGVVDAMAWLGLMPISIDHQYEYSRCNFVCIYERANEVKEGDLIPKALIIVSKTCNVLTYDVEML